MAALPDGLETVVADRGARLSRGERQRIVLAGALLRRPALLVLDQATGPFDATAEREVAAALRSLRGRTTIVAVTHRKGLMKAADRIVLLANGRGGAAGTWPELAPRLADGHNRRDADSGGRSQAEGAPHPATVTSSAFPGRPPWRDPARSRARPPTRSSPTVRQCRSSSLIVPRPAAAEPVCYDSGHDTARRRTHRGGRNRPFRPPVADRHHDRPAPDP